MRRHLLRPLSMAITFSLSFTASAAINTAAIVASTLSPTCLEYQVVGICYWLLCTPFGCTVKTSTKVRHYVPDAVVSAYSNTGMNPWIEMSTLGSPNPMAQAGNDGTTNHVAENNITKFKEADVIGHPGGATFSQFASASGYVCKGATLPLVPYFLSTLDPLAWRYGVPESVYPEALIPGMREVSSLLTASNWGNLYPRSGFLHQVDDYKTGAVIAQRAGDITTRIGQVHVYLPMLALPMPGYWPAGALLEGIALTGKWQELTPTLNPTCATFPSITPNIDSQDGGYAWALWRPYSCCERRGQTFLGSTDFL
ncbi:TIGR03756 family integrating conjugative element protein [Pseudomonas gingeri NCPPB 3146 = LMG 5327]|uniref:TIGR03756 family integrating conjugative element protein n=2 Tax=Pseudomonas gingeri TaxID=117681 RepID=A0A7Y7Y3S7_9PSED|nr:TIGR03756 family integrating conjugative element protein [Pseudomonas gingeri]NWC16568.1 TIGR03756 family integrating conjugative element protein [Pseudomonas gingeri]PNQ87909.1 TIGR03756 family integrating conjugative element protein [Pseudomonas gingeri NCPPB 3146 = LMG 5327]